MSGLLDAVWDVLPIGLLLLSILFGVWVFSTEGSEA